MLARYSLMSSRTLPRRFERSRASFRLERRRVRSRRWFDRFSRRRERLFCLTAEEVRAASESSRRASWVMVDSRWGRMVSTDGRHSRWAAGNSYGPSPGDPQSWIRCRAPLVKVSAGYSMRLRTANRYGRGFGSGHLLAPEYSLVRGEGSRLTWLSRFRACCRSWVQPVFPDGADMVAGVVLGTDANSDVDETSPGSKTEVPVQPE